MCGARQSAGEARHAHIPDNVITTHTAVIYTQDDMLHIIIWC